MALLHYEDLRNAILVGHSYGGMVITGAADRVPDRVGHLVYLDAKPPKHGQSLVDVAGPFMAAARSDSQVVDGTEPIFGRVAGDKASVNRAIGQLLSQLVIAARTRSRDSCNAVSGNPTRCTQADPR